MELLYFCINVSGVKQLVYACCVFWLWVKTCNNIFIILSHFKVLPHLSKGIIWITPVWESNWLKFMQWVLSEMGIWIGPKLTATQYCLVLTMVVLALVDYWRVFICLKSWRVWIRFLHLFSLWGLVTWGFLVTPIILFLGYSHSNIFQWLPISAEFITRSIYVWITLNFLAGSNWLVQTIQFLVWSWAESTQNFIVW